MSKIVGITVGTTMNPEKIAEKFPGGGSGGSSLPAVTEEDEGKILKAQDGKWTIQEDEIARPLSNLEIEELIKNFT